MWDNSQNDFAPFYNIPNAVKYSVILSPILFSRWLVSAWQAVEYHPTSSGIPRTIPLFQWMKTIMEQGHTSVAKSRHEIISGLQLVQLERSSAKFRTLSTEEEESWVLAKPDGNILNSVLFEFAQGKVVYGARTKRDGCYRGRNLDSVLFCQKLIPPNISCWKCLPPFPAPNTTLAPTREKYALLGSLVKLFSLCLHWGTVHSEMDQDWTGFPYSTGKNFVDISGLQWEMGIGRVPFCCWWI